MSSLNVMALGAICDHNVALRDLDGDKWRFQTYVIAPDRPSFRRILDSAFSSPARYIQEIFLRLCETDGQSCESMRFVFNPLFATTRANILTTVAALRSRKDLTGPAVVVDQEGLPAGYLLPKIFDAHEARYLTLLSAVDTALDAALLECLCFSKTVVIQAPQLNLSKHGHNGFDDHGLWPVYCWIAQQAISQLQAIARLNLQCVDRASARRQRDAIPFTAIMPNHAGDVLFFALAFNQITSPYQRIAVNRAYADIVGDAAPLLHAVEIDIHQVNRDRAFAAGKAVRDYDYFRAYKDSLPQESFYTYCRPSRNYNTTNIHLIDHFAFALGYSPRNESELLIKMRLVPPRQGVPLSVNSPARILLHFDAGWPLKVYPPSMQYELIELLRSRGHEVTVLAPLGYSHPGIKTATFRSLSEFVALARAHHIIVGMDSFPSHYCVHVLGLPTLCLFASTKPANSNALPSDHYAYLERGLRCRPCYAVSHCPVYGGGECRNFVDPRLVTSQILKLLAGVPDAPFIESAPQLQSDASPSTINIHMYFIGFQVWVANFLPPVLLLKTLIHEFLHAIHREGMLAALRRSGRFLVRKFRARC